MNSKLEAALAYSRMRWRIFPCHSIVNGRCSCGKPACTSPGKHPRTRGGFKDATDDPAQITRWWTRWADANIALATGSGLAVIDIDGEEGFHEFRELVKAQGTLPETLVAQTGRGYHLVFATRADSSQVRSSARGNVHVRGEGGYIIVAPSGHVSGKNYKWIKKNPIAVLPEWLRQWTQGYEITANKPSSNALGLGPLPQHLSKQNQRDVGEALHESLKTVWSPAEQARLISALSAIPVKDCGYEDFLKIGFALHGLGWEGNGTDLGFTIWDSWCQQSEHYNPAGLQEKWRSFGKSGREGVTLGTVYHMARQAGWSGGAPDPSPKLNGHANGAHALPATFLNSPQAIFFPDLNDKNQPRSTMVNAIVAIQGLGIACRKDVFHDKTLVGGEVINQWAGDLSDDIIHVIRKMIRYKFGFDPNKNNTIDACVELSSENHFNPVLDYLDGLRWDGTSRLETWLTRYMGAEDTELTRAIGRLSLIAAVRRARKPGTKFDQIVVLEGPEGKGKSLAIETLAGRENFSDGKILGLGDREQQEAVAGVWLYEIAELTGMRKAEIEHVKAFASRTVDRARPAYGRFRIDRPRTTIFFATTNRDDYLQSDTGNRRFWPVSTDSIDLEALRADRDQLWAEAAMCEARGDSIGLPERLWAEASEKQEGRRESDDWLELIARYIATKQLSDVSTTEVLCDNQWIQRKPDMVSRADAMRAGAILKRLKFARYHKRIEGGYAWRYKRS